MNLFYTTDIKDDHAHLNEEESFHCVRVLRMRTGDEIVFVDGAGGYYKGTLEEADSKKCTIKIDEITPIICEHSERRVVKEERLKKVIQSAMKQSLKAYLPKLKPAIEFTKF